MYHSLPSPLIEIVIDWTLEDCIGNLMYFDVLGLVPLGTNIGLPTRGSALLQLGLTFFLSFGPLIAFVVGGFGALTYVRYSVLQCQNATELP